MKNLLLYTLLFSLIIMSCNKVADPTPTPQAAPNTTPTFGNADGVFAAVSTITYQNTPIGDMAVDVDVAFGGYNNGTNTYVEIGSVSVNSYNLEKADNNSYLSTSSTTTPVIDLGFDDSSNNSWVISGSSNMPAFNYTTSNQMPSSIKFTAEVEKINKANSFTLSIQSAPSNCDSLLFVLAGTDNVSVIKTVASNVTSVTFTSAEMSQLNGTGIAQVVAYNYDLSVQNGKNMYFINEVVISDFLKFE